MGTAESGRRQQRGGISAPAANRGELVQVGTSVQPQVRPIALDVAVVDGMW